MVSFQIELKICDVPIYSVCGYRLTNNKNGINTYKYQVLYTPIDFIGDTSANRIGTISIETKGVIEHQYDDGLMILCEKILHKINTELGETDAKDGI